MHEYDIKYTKLAEAFLGSFKNAFEEKLRGELAHDLPEDVYPPEIFFHSLEYDTSGYRRTYVAIGKGDHLLVDSATMEETTPVEAGPLKGRRLQVPKPDSGD